MEKTNKNNINSITGSKRGRNRVNRASADDNRLDAIRSKIESGFYDGPGQLGALADKLINKFNLGNAK